MVKALAVVCGHRAFAVARQPVDVPAPAAARGPAFIRVRLRDKRADMPARR